MSSRIRLVTLAVAAAAVVAVFLMASSSAAFLLYGYQGKLHVFAPPAPASFGPGVASPWATFSTMPTTSPYTGGFKLHATLYNSTSAYSDIGTMTVYSDQLAITVASVSGSLIGGSGSYAKSVIIEIEPAGTPPLPPGTYYGCTIEINETSNGPLEYYYEYTYAVSPSGTTTTGPTSAQQCWLTGKSPGGMPYYVTITVVGNSNQMVTPGEDLGSLLVSFNFNAAWYPTSAPPSSPAPPPGGGGSS